MRTEEILHTSARERSDAAAIVDQRGVTSYARLLELSQKISTALRTAEIPKSSIIGISILDAREFLATLFGVIEAHCVAIPISPQLSATEQARVIADTGVTWIIDSAIETSSAQTLDITELPTLRIQKTHSSWRGISPRFSDAAVIRHTSGTTAHSKGVVLSHSAVIERTEACMSLLGVTKDDVVLAPLPLAYHFVASALSFIRAGATIIDCAALSPTQTIELGAKSSATMIYGSPLQYELMARATTDHRLTRLRRAISTSALLPSTTANLFEARFGTRLTQVYGVIEVGLPLWNTDPTDSPSLLGRCPAPYECRVIDDGGVEVAIGEIGELVVKGPGLFSGYIRGEEGAPLADKNGWFHTGDLVSRDARGAIAYRGRKKSVINCAGNKIFPEEVESVLRQAPHVREARVFSEPHPLLGSLVVAEIVPSNNEDYDTSELRRLCYAQLSGFKVPKEFRIVEDIPVTGSGKVLRHAPILEEAAA